MSDALLIVGHGTRSGAGVAECLELADHVRRMRPGLRVAVGNLELHPPLIEEAVDELMAEGFSEIAAVPLVLFTARHAKSDIPAALEQCQQRHSGLRVAYATPLGIRPELLDMVDERVAEVVPPEQRSETGVLIVRAGSTDPDANGDLAKLARLFWEGRPYPLVEPAFAGITSPTVPEALERMRRLGLRRIVTVPYFLFTGELSDRVRRQTEDFGAGNRAVSAVTTAHLGPDERIAQVVLARLDEARAGVVRVNCDTCVYRAPLPGFEGRVGLPHTVQ